MTAKKYRWAQALLGIREILVRSSRALHKGFNMNSANNTNTCRILYNSFICSVRRFSMFANCSAYLQNPFRFSHFTFPLRFMTSFLKWFSSPFDSKLCHNPTFTLFHLTAPIKTSDNLKNIVHFTTHTRFVASVTIGLITLSPKFTKASSAHQQLRLSSGYQFLQLLITCRYVTNIARVDYRSMFRQRCIHLPPETPQTDYFIINDRPRPTHRHATLCSTSSG